MSDTTPLTPTQQHRIAGDFLCRHVLARHPAEWQIQSAAQALSDEARDAAASALEDMARALINHRETTGHRATADSTLLYAAAREYRDGTRPAGREHPITHLVTSASPTPLNVADVEQLRALITDAQLDGNLHPQATDQRDRLARAKTLADQLVAATRQARQQ